MMYSDLLRILSTMSPEQLANPVLVTLGNDQDEITGVEGTQTLREASEDAPEGTLLLRLT
jgi:hypothetical protein